MKGLFNFIFSVIDDFNFWLNHKCPRFWYWPIRIIWYLLRVISFIAGLLLFSAIMSKCSSSNIQPEEHKWLFYVITLVVAIIIILCTYFDDYGDGRKNY